MIIRLPNQERKPRDPGNEATEMQMALKLETRCEAEQIEDTEYK